MRAGHFQFDLPVNTRNCGMFSLARARSGCALRIARRSVEALSRRTSPQLNEQFRKLIVGAMLMLFWLIPAAHFRKQLNGAQPIAHLAAFAADDLG